MPRNKDADQMADSRFEGRGLGLRHGQRPVSVNARLQKIWIAMFEPKRIVLLG